MGKVMKRSIGLGVAAVAALAVACSAQGGLGGNGTQALAGAARSSAAPSSVRIGYQEIPNTEEIVRAKGWAEQALKGIKINYFPFNSGKDVISAMSSGSVDIAVIGSSPAAAALAQGLHYEVIDILDVEGRNEALVVRKNEHIKTLQDLKGKTIATPFGSTSAFSLFMALKQAKIDPNSLKIVDMEPQDMLAAWQRGNIDGGYVWEPTLAKMVSHGGTVILNSGQLAAKGVVTADILVARKDFAEKYPNVVAAYLKANLRAYDFYKKSPGQAAAVIAKAFAIPKAEAAHDMSELIWLSAKQELSPQYLGTSKKVGAMGRIMKSNADFLVQQGDLAQSAPLSVFNQAVQPKYLEMASK
ncbi:MAG: aliphatic sulfonate ABC transporter substrate-binding protein [Alicyclobacillus sp.]|nr:aliphatic sulfonate ABC transporter substrate-binding protein [Alicyclobacillus sp.]